MLADLLRLLLFFEIFAYVFGTFMLTRWLHVSVMGAMTLLLCFSITLRIGGVGVVYLFGYFHRTLDQQPLVWDMPALLKTLLRESCIIGLLEWTGAFPSLFMRKDARKIVAAHKETNKLTPFLLVHGYAGNRGVWWWLKPRLESRGYPVATVTLEPLQGDIDGYTEQIARRVEWLRTELKADRIILVGHGMGGLACLAYLRRYGEDHVERLITMGTAHAGTTLLHLYPGWGRNLRQMSVNSAWLNDLKDFFEEMPLVIPYVILHGLHDLLMNPVETVTMKGADYRAITGLGHWEMLASPRVLESMLMVRE